MRACSALFERRALCNHTPISHVNVGQLVAECKKGAGWRAELLRPRGVLSRLHAAHPAHRAVFDEATLSPGNYTSIVLGEFFGAWRAPHPACQHWLGPTPPPRACGSTAVRDTPTMVASNEPPLLIITTSARFFFLCVFSFSLSFSSPSLISCLALFCCSGSPCPALPVCVCACVCACVHVCMCACFLHVFLPHFLFLARHAHRTPACPLVPARRVRPAFWLVRARCPPPAPAGRRDC